MPTISVEHLNKSFKVHKKEAGIKGSLKGLFKREYHTVHAVKDVSFTIQKGELVGFIGPNGAGKTTTLKCLSGLLYPTSGKVEILGFTPFERKNNYLKQIALVMGQKNQLWWDLPAIETFQLNKEIYQISDKQFAETISSLAELLEVKDFLHVQVRKLSLGQRMKCELIGSLIHSPKILFLDEPTIGLDVVMQQNLREFIRDYNKRYEATIILTSHYMQDVQELCERVLIIDQGSLLYDGKLEEIIKAYAKHKYISCILQTAVPKYELEKLGKVTVFAFPKMTLEVPLADTKRVASKLLNDFPVEDLTIEDIAIEEIIRDIFVTKGGN